jgi:hypothetical protein
VGAIACLRCRHGTAWQNEGKSARDIPKVFGLSVEQFVFRLVFNHFVREIGDF